MYKQGHPRIDPRLLVCEKGKDPYSRYLCAEHVSVQTKKKKWDLGATGPGRGEGPFGGNSVVDKCLMYKLQYADQYSYGHAQRQIGQRRGVVLNLHAPRGVLPGKQTSFG